MSFAYIRKVHYHETDKMGITHHANYIKWMEEARIQFLEEIGYGYDRLEAEGIVSPVIGVNCRYKHPSTFADQVRIEVRVGEFRGVRLQILYTMTNITTGQPVLTGETSHCFTDRDCRPLILKKVHPELDALLRKLSAEV